MDRDLELEKLIRDCKLYSICVQFPFYDEKSSIDSHITFEFVRFNTSKFKIKLFTPKLFYFFDDECGGIYISHIKCFKKEDGFILSLDPEDERIDEISNNDNMVIEFERYEIE